MYVLLDDDQYRLTLRPWHRMPARRRAARLDRELAGGASPDASAALAARSMQLTSTQYRRGLAASVQQILTAAGQPPVGIPSKAVAARRPRISLRRAPIGQSAQLLAEQAGHLAGPGQARSRCKAWQ